MPLPHMAPGNPVLAHHLLLLSNPLSSSWGIQNLTSKILAFKNDSCTQLANNSEWYFNTIIFQVIFFKKKCKEMAMLEKKTTLVDLI